MIVKGVITKITNFGVFVELEEGLEGLLHISELSDSKIENPQDVVKCGQEVEVKILRVDTDDRKIGLSLKRAQWTSTDTKPASEKGTSERSSSADGEEVERPRPSGKPSPARGGLDDHGAMGSDKFSF
jgi:small subunit ribosomal protein S1